MGGSSGVERRNDAGRRGSPIRAALTTSVVLLVVASCGPGSEEKVDAGTTGRATTTIESTIAPTTTEAGAVVETELLADRLEDVPGYQYLDYSPMLVEHEVLAISASDLADEQFSSLSRHLVTKDSHYIAEIVLLQLRDPDATLDDIHGALIELFDPNGMWVVAEETEGDTPIMVVTGSTMHMWVSIHDGVAAAIFYMGIEGNEAFGVDFAHAYAATAQGSPLPQPTAQGVLPGGELTVEDEHLMSHLLPIDGYLYLDTPTDLRLDLYDRATQSEGVVSASNHFVIASESLANDGWTPLIYLEMWDIVDSALSNPSKVLEVLRGSATQFAAEGTEPVVGTIDVDGQEVLVAGYQKPDGLYGESYAFEHAGVLYIMHAMPDCADPDGDVCHEDVLSFMARFASATEQTD